MIKGRIFLYYVILAAIIIASTAALFSITGIASLFAGHFIQVAIMAGSLEFGKLVIASFLYRYWDIISKMMKTYLIFALVILILITSAGIFGYLSDAYQKTKGDYTLIENQTSVLKIKQGFFENRKNRLIIDKDVEIGTKQHNMVRADSLTVRGQSITRTRTDIKDGEVKIYELENNIAMIEDSISKYGMKIIELEHINVKGELGPLVYVALAFNSSIDDVVRFFIFLLIFVFDPLAVFLVIAANMIYELQFDVKKIKTKKRIIKNKQNSSQISLDKINKIDNINNVDTINISDNSDKPDKTNEVDIPLIQEEIIKTDSEIKAQSEILKQNTNKEIEENKIFPSNLVGEYTNLTDSSKKHPRGWKTSNFKF